MPRPSKIPIVKNPLRQLRSLLGETQTQLSHRCDIPFSTIRAVEAGQRRFSRNIQDKVKVMTGAIWDGRKRRWMVRRDLRDAELVPCERADIEEYAKLLAWSGTGTFNRDRDALKMRVDALFDQIPEEQRLRLLFRILPFLDGLHKEFRRKIKNQDWEKRDELDKVFKVTERRRYLHDLMASEMRRYWKRMAQYYGEKAKNIRDDGAIVFTWPVAS
jgi:hypothetical protein